MTVLSFFRSREEGQTHEDKHGLTRVGSAASVAKLVKTVCGWLNPIMSDFVEPLLAGAYVLDVLGETASYSTIATEQIRFLNLDGIRLDASLVATGQVVPLMYTTADRLVYRQDYLIDPLNTRILQIHISQNFSVCFNAAISTHQCGFVR